MAAVLARMRLDLLELASAGGSRASSDFEDAAGDDRDQADDDQLDAARREQADERDEDTQHDERR